MIIHWQGLDIVLESPVAKRYGYIRGTKGEDGAALDCIVGKHLDSHTVFIFDKVRRSGRFDETKVMIGFYTIKGALRGWDKKYSRSQLGKQRRVSIMEFFHLLHKKWGHHPKQTASFEEVQRQLRNYRTHKA